MSAQPVVGVMTESEWVAWLRERSAEPEVRSMMALFKRLYNDYEEDADGFSWLVVDATRVIDGVKAGRDLNPGYAPDDRAYILDALVDSGRLDPGEPDPPADILDALETEVATLRATSLNARGDQ